ncbi:MAG: glycosyltransferase [Novosphingobium sp.]|nr:glycosyltransferase [Novosphingobium sp.]
MAGGEEAAPVAVVVLAHNEERRIARCLATLPLSDPGFAVHVVVNGSRDGTAAIVAGIAARHENLTLHDWPEPGKARSWNRIVLDTLPPGLRAVVLVDGDAEVAPGAIPALLAALAAHPEANLASAPPLNGRRARHYQQLMARSHGVFGDLYALRGSFVDAFRRRGIRLPLDLVGDDGLVGALAKTDLGPLSSWREDGVQPVMAAGFRCEPFSPLALQSWRMQHGRMINYAVRHFQDRIITDILRDHGPQGLPERLASLYSRHLPGFAPRGGLWSWFDRQALARMRAAVL